MKRGSRAQVRVDDEPAEEENVATETTAPAKDENPVLKRRKLRKRAYDLVARASHDSTPEEEARTSALVAARLIHSEKLLDDEPRHPLVDRLEALGDDMLDVLAGPVEAILDGGLMDRFTRLQTRQVADHAHWWRTEARVWQRRLHVHTEAMRWILANGRIGLADRPGKCGICRRALAVGTMIAWKRRRADAMHYACCVEQLERQYSRT